MNDLDTILDSWKLIAAPFGDEESKHLVGGVCSKTILEVVRHFAGAGGRVDILEKVMREHLAVCSDSIYPAVAIPDNFLDSPPPRLSTEFYWLLCMEAKRIQGDWWYKYDDPSVGLFSKDHRPFELGPLEGRVAIEKGTAKDFGGLSGKNFGTAIAVFRALIGDDITRRLSDTSRIRPNAETVSHHVDQQTKKLLGLLNLFIAREQDKVTMKALVDPDQYYDIRLAANMYDFMRILSGREDILKEVGRRNLPDLVKKMMRPFPIEQCYKNVIFFSGRYNQSIRTEFVTAGLDFAVIRVHPTDMLVRQTGPYFRRVLANTCQMAKNIMGSIPAAVYGLEAYPVLETACAIEAIARPDPRALPPTLDRKLRDEILSRAGHEDERDGGADGFCEYIYRWKAGPTGIMRLFDPTCGGDDGIFPSLEDVITRPVHSLGQIAKLAMAVTPLGAILTLLRSQERHKSFDALAETLESVVRDYEAATAAISAKDAAQFQSGLDIAHSVLYEMGVAYQGYVDSLRSGRLADANRALRALQECARRYLTTNVLSDAQDVGREEFRQRIRAAQLFLSFGQAIGERVDPLSGRWHNRVFRVERPSGVGVLKQFDMRAMDISKDPAHAEFLVYKWIAEESVEARLRFPTPEVLAYNEIQVRDESTGRVVPAPVLLMENVEGPNLYGFFRLLDRRDSPEIHEHIVALKDEIVRAVVDRYCFIAGECENERRGSLGLRIRQFREKQGLKQVDYYDKTMSALSVIFGPEPAVIGWREVVAEQLSKQLEGIKTVPFFDMAPRNHGMNIVRLYSKFLLCEGLGEMDANADAQVASSGDATKLFDIISDYLSDDRRTKLSKLCTDASVLFKYDFESVARDTAEFDDLSHIVSSPAYNPSVEQRVNMHMYYIVQRYVADSHPEKAHLISLLWRGDVGEAEGLLSNILDYEMLEASRALVSVYRNLRWAALCSRLEWKNREESDTSDEVGYHLRTAVQEIADYLSVKKLDSESYLADSEPVVEHLRQGGVAAGMVYLKRRILELIGGD